VIQIAQRIEKKIVGFKSQFKVAVMGCEVNGPGEAKEADVGLAGSKKYGVIFKKGKIVKKVSKKDMFEALFEEVKKLETN
jgi:(E)-4-hydroxy-3-methylbut-2-enyl-diphosphate synthase